MYAAIPFPGVDELFEPELCSAHGLIWWSHEVVDLKESTDVE